jgi:spore maturation protein CgeB
VTGRPLRFTVLGLSITSSWGNGHATTYRALLRELAARGHDVLFLERDVPWYAAHRDLPQPPFCRTELYSSLHELQQRHAGAVRDADVVIVGSYVPGGIDVGEWVTRTASGVTAFYDIDTPVTLAALAAGGCDYLTPQLIGRFDLYLSFTGGPVLERLEREYGAAAARPLYCSFDPALYYPDAHVLPRWDLGYMGTYSGDRQPTLQRLLLDSARRWGGGRFVVAGPQYPQHIPWSANVERIEHLPPAEHRAFYCAQRFTLNVTRAAMIETGYAPSVRLFEAAGCATPVISDSWDGLDTLFAPGREILVPRSAHEVVEWLVDMPEQERRRIGAAAYARVHREHTAAHRALELENRVREVLSIEPAA